ncbi:hypothetical protein EN866_32825 [Mesorhizobium sp. M2D.F.Ca.ET.223.01.1.1]|uniref:hypothetical protein n=1 Tax=Mesorhizobium sp. M2D.F.Ca.ET.223.01.1.1 TaxID=2563940 RepID=UPI001091EA97|nr:hypothetical protein [Mesorhizobium sp. M2D.F.Ca.ET.223.01.1.1]TGR84592.1 hypothetical protein EN866_32825 [Mesorhizobium sp. M2D.F.Ca.ET.223.01.1.1]TGT70705.1 hypothetical protein EN802_20470 [bacterium M00.F.Ca.ET.159.01.1.1]TGT82348.1 hypothetical protein EN800_18630 [bacterium M00.F.Ca.ET.157.01.1.1]
MTDKRKEPDLATASREELVAYITRLKASRDQMKANNKEVSKYANRVNEAVTHLASDCSLVFQAMAEKAGVRGHPSVTEVVKLFDSIMHSQWQKEDFPKVEWPTDWNFDDANQWTGDADMQLNAPIAKLIELLDFWSIRALKDSHREAIGNAIVEVQRAMRTHIEGIKANHGFRKMTVDVTDAPNGIGMAILDLAQDMEFANSNLRRDLRAATYRRVCADLYTLSQCEFEERPTNFDVYLVGGQNPPF